MKKNQRKLTMTENKPRKKSGWGFGIFALYGVFVLFVLGLVLFSTFNPYSLVTDDYYEKELRYQDQIDRMNNANQLSAGLDISYDRSNRQIVLSYPADAVIGELKGTVTMFRPSDAEHDVVYPVQVDQDGRQYIRTDNLLRGLWRMKVDWTSAGGGYYVEEVVIIK